MFLSFFCHRLTAPRLDQNPGKHVVVFCALDCRAWLSLQGEIEGCVRCTVLHLSNVHMPSLFVLLCNYLLQYRYFLSLSGYKVAKITFPRERMSGSEYGVTV